MVAYGPRRGHLVPKEGGHPVQMRIQFWVILDTPEGQILALYATHVFCSMGILGRCQDVEDMTEYLVP